MYDKFYELSKTKQLQIINAAMEVFSKNDYKKASTDDIAAKAGISKGSLFFYFKNKKSLYLFLYQYTADIMKNYLIDEHYKDITDFFELLEYCACQKVEIMESMPFLFDFSMRCFYPEDKNISDDLNAHSQGTVSSIYSIYLKHIDFSKFREEVDPPYLINMFVWIADGYIHQRQMLRQPLKTGEMMIEFRKWMKMIRPLVYKEEFL